MIFTYIHKDVGNNQFDLIYNTHNILTRTQVEGSLTKKTSLWC